MLFLVLASVLGKSLLSAGDATYGLDVGNLLTIDVRLQEKQLGLGTVARLSEIAMDRISALPGIVSATPVAEFPFLSGFRPAVVGDAVPANLPRRTATTATFPAVLGMTLQSGRWYTAEGIRLGAPLAVISSTLADRYWRNEEALGASLSRVHASLAQFQVIGVADQALTAVAAHQKSVLFTPMHEITRVRILARTAESGVALLRPIHAIMREITPGNNVSVEFLSDRLDKEVGLTQIAATIAVVLGTFTVSLALIGIAGVARFIVYVRTREIGIRIALGASRHSLAHLLLTQALRPVVFGGVLGLVAGALLNGLFGRILLGVSPQDPFALAAAAAAILLTSLVTVLVPVWAACTLAPSVVLRNGH